MKRLKGFLIGLCLVACAATLVKVGAYYKERAELKRLEEAKRSKKTLKGAFIFQGFAVGPGRGGIWMASADGSKLRQIWQRPQYWVGTDYSPDASPDGKYVAVTFIGPNSRGQWFHVARLGLLSVDDGQLKELFCKPYPGHDVELPSWSPDGKYIAFLLGPRDERHCGPQGKLRIILSTGGSSRTLSDIKFSSKPSWSPDGKRIVISGDQEIYEVRLSNETISPRGLGTSPSWSHDGKKLAYFDAKGYLTVNGLRLAHVDPWARVLDPVEWSPDDQYVAYTVPKGGPATIVNWYPPERDAIRVAKVDGSASFEAQDWAHCDFSWN